MDVLSKAGATSGGGECFAIVGIMTFASASKTKTFPKATSVFGGGEFCDSDSVDIHCIGVSLGVGNEGQGLGMTSSEGLDMLFLSIEGFGAVDPVFDCCRDGGHEEDHNSEVLVQPEGELVNKGYVISDSCFGNKV